MKNNTFEEIALQIKKANSIVLFPHILSDGDSLGSCVALTLALRSLGKKALIAIEDKIPEHIQFLDKEYTKDYTMINPQMDLSICVDCSSKDRLPKRVELFESANVHMCLDHHLVEEHFCEYNYINHNIAATGEIIFKVIKSLGVQIDKEMAEALFCSITMDTGNFQYSNTTKESHLISAELIEAGADINKVSNAIYENESLDKMKLQCDILSNVELLCNGKIAMAYVSLEMLKANNAKIEDSEGIVSRLRSIKGVEVAVLVKEKQENVIKVSLRAKTTANVFDVARKFGGGGHKKAAGCTINTTLEEAYNKIKKEVEISFE